MTTIPVADVPMLCRLNDFDDRSIQKGVRYAAQGRVLQSNVTLRGNVAQVHALVSGSERQPYEVTVEVELEGSELYVEGDCTCPVGFNCKHVVAALAAAQGHAPNTANNGSNNGSNNGRPLARIEPADVQVNEPVLSPEVQSWLKGMASPEKTASTTPAAPAVQLQFSLSVSEYYASRTIQVAMMRSTRKRNGEFGKPQNLPMSYSQSDLVDNEDYAEDRQLLVSLFGNCGYRREMELKGRASVELLRKILETGRCWWDERARFKLRLGSPRAAKPVWKELETGLQKTDVELIPPATKLLPTSPPWYLDLKDGTCGPVEFDGDAGKLAHWLSGPALRPEESQALAEAANSRALPVPKSFKVRNRRGIRPVPVLRLWQKPLKHSAFGTRRGSRQDVVNAIDVATLELDYGGTVVKPNSPGDHVVRKAGDELERIYRMPRVERDIGDQIENWDLLPLDELFWMGSFGSSENDYAVADPQEWYAWVVETLPSLREQGWRVEIDPSFSYRPAEVEGWYSETEGSGEDWFSYELGILVEGQRVNLMPMLGKILTLLSEEESARGKRIDTIQWKMTDGRIVELPAERLRSIAATLAELFDPDSLRGDKLQVSRLRAAELVDLCDEVPWRGPAELQEMHARLREFSGIAPVASPAGLKATLRSYQTEGLSWLQFLRQQEFGGILADDMGLGKTVQAISHVLLEKESGRAAAPSLVIAPTSLMANWRAEAEKFAPDLKVLILHGGGRKERFEEIASHDLVVTSYALLTKDREILEKHDFHLLILDEAQYIKNAKTQWAEICRALKAKHRLCMTGTPMENHLGELWSLMHFVSPGYLGSEKQFRRIYRDPIEKHGDKERRSALAKRVRPFIMRRRKEEVATELPEKTEIVRNVEIDGKQRDLYETIRIAMHERVRAEVAQKGMARSHIVILDALLKLRQVCCDPRLVKLERAKAVRESAKLDLLKEMLPEMISEGRRILLFSQFTSMLDLIENAVVPMEIPFVRLTGDTVDRETPVKKFQSGQVPLFLISLKAGGTGLNLTAADTVIHYDPWWNPAVERQATDRAHRIGQNKKVFVYKLVTTGTVEEKILAMQERKKELVAGLLGEGAQENLQLSKEDLDHLFDPLG